MQPRCSPAILAAMLVLAAASAAHAGITVSLIDTGAPKVPTSLSPTGFMDGYTGYILRLTSDGDPASTWSFAPIPGSAIYGNFAQRWTSSDGSAISGGNGYDTPSPGLTSFKNDAPSVWNTDSHFLGDASQAISNVVENVSFTTPANTNPFSFKSNDFVGYGMGTFLTGTISILGQYRTAGPKDVAYLVVPNTNTDIRFFNAQVVTSSLAAPTVFNGFMISSPGMPANSSWIGNSGGSWNDGSRWSPITTFNSYKVSSNGGAPHAAGDMALFDSITSNSIVTLDGNKTVSLLRMGSNDIRPGTGGALTFDNPGVFSTISPRRSLTSVFPFT